MEKTGEAENFECAVEVPDIIRMVGVCRSKFDKCLRDDMLRCGAVFRIRKGRPPRVRIMGFPSEIRKYIAIQAAKGGII